MQSDGSHGLGSSVRYCPPCGSYTDQEIGEREDGPLVAICLVCDYNGFVAPEQGTRVTGIPAGARGAYHVHQWVFRGNRWRRECCHRGNRRHARPNVVPARPEPDHPLCPLIPTAKET